MTDNILINETEKKDKLRAVVLLSAVVMLSLGLSLWAGFAAVKNDAVGIAGISDPFGDNFWLGAAKLCSLEALTLAVLTFCRGAVGRTVFTVLIFSLRGAAMGAGAAAYAENTAYGEAAGLLVSFGAATLLTAFYCLVMYRQGSEMPLLYKLAAYAVAFGAAASIRIIPYLLL